MSASAVDRDADEAKAFRAAIETLKTIDAAMRMYESAHFASLPAVSLEAARSAKALAVVLLAQLDALIEART